MIELTKEQIKEADELSFDFLHNYDRDGMPKKLKYTNGEIGSLFSPEERAEREIWQKSDKINLSGIYIVQAWKEEASLIDNGLSCLKDNGLFKIGYSTNIQERLKTLNSHSPERINLIYCEKASLQKETELHQLFKEYKHHGEWFKNCKEIRYYPTRKIKEGQEKRRESESEDINIGREKCPRKSIVTDLIDRNSE